MTPLKCLAFQVPEGFVHATALNAVPPLPSFDPREQILSPSHISTVAGLWAKGLDWRILRCDKATGENAACSAGSPLEDGAAVL
jgi:hypothetical protein